MFTNIFQELDFGTDFLVATINTYIIFSGFLLEIVLLNLKLFPTFWLTFLHKIGRMTSCHVKTSKNTLILKK